MMELLGKIQSIRSHSKRKPSKQSIMIAAEATIEFFEEIAVNLPIELTKWIKDEIDSIYNIQRQFLKEKLENDSKNPN